MKFGKKRSEEHIIGEQGVEILKQKLPKHWVVREYHPDYGIDLSVELFEDEEPHITKGAHLFFQVKTTKIIEHTNLKITHAYNIEKPNHNETQSPIYMEVVKYNMDVDFLSTVERMGSAVPLILAVVDLSSETVFYLCVSDYIEKVLRREEEYLSQRTKTVYIPACNVIDDQGISVIEWYAKRPKLYALFNKIRYQSRELEHVHEDNIIEYIDYFIKLLYRFDVWEEPIIIPFMQELRDELVYYNEHGMTKFTAGSIESMEKMGQDVDEEIWEATYCDVNRLVSFRRAQTIQGLHILWEQLDNLGNIFEEDCKEYFLPTYYWASMMMDWNN